MNRPTDEEIIAYVDDALPYDARAAFEARMAEDPTLVEEVERHRDTVARVRAAYPTAEEKSFDAQALAALGLGGAEVVDISAAREARRAGKPGPLIWSGAIAAALVGGILIGRVTTPTADMVAARQGQLVAAASLEKALDEQPDGGNGAIKIGTTFRTAAGYCRTFLRADGYAGLGCREGDGWVIPAVVKSRAAEPHSPDFRLAGDDFPPAVMAEVDTRIVGAPLTPTEVDQARRAKWR
jgi:anti-sigma factor RsiW